MSGHFLDHERLADLLVQQATDGLSQTEQLELDELLRGYPDADPETLERTAAAVFLAGDWQEEAVPPAVKARLDAAASSFTAAQLRVVPTPDRNSDPPASVETSSRPGGTLGWFAAAAAVIVAVVAWWPRLQDQQNQQVDVLTQASLDIATLSEIRERFVATANPLIKEWAPTEDPAAPGVKGDVVWDAATQTGYMRFTGLPVNDPAQTQYQLWIFDSTRDDRYPVDGGVFNIPAGATEVVVPILAKLPVGAPTLFAVTIEKPGGAVVSAREHIVAVAPVSSG